MKQCEICNQQHQGSGDVCQLCHLGFNTQMAKLNDSLELSNTLFAFIEKSDVPLDQWMRASFYFKKSKRNHPKLHALQVEHLKTDEVKQ